jgi:hypothetical protein
MAARSAILILVSVYPSTCLSAVNSDPAHLAATKSLDEISAGLTHRFDHLENLTMRYLASEVMVNGDAPGAVPNEKTSTDGRASFLGDKRLNYPWMKFEQRLHKSKRFFQFIAPQFGLTENLPPIPEGWPIDNYASDDRYTTQAMAWDGNIRTRVEVQGTGSISEDYHNHTLSNLVFKFLDYPVHELSTLEQDNLYLPSSLSSGVAKVLPQLERIGTNECHIVDVEGRDRLWIDVNCGFALLKRVTRYQSTGDLRRELLTDGWTEVTPGLWLPSQIEVNYYCSPADHPDKAGTISSKISIQITYLTHELSDDMFRVDFPDGTVVTDVRYGTRYVQGGGEPLKPMYLADYPEYARPALSRNAFRTALFWVNVIAVLVFAFLVLVKKGLLRW